MSYQALNYYGGITNPIIPVRYNKVDYALIYAFDVEAEADSTYKERRNFLLINVVTGEVTPISFSTPLEGRHIYHKLVDFNLRGSKVVARFLGGDKYNTPYNIRLLEIEVDLSALSASWSELWKIDANADADINGKCVESIALSNRFLLVTESDKPYLWFIDAKDGSVIDKFDTGFSSYNPRCSDKLVAKPDDVYMLLGRHYSGDDFRVLKVYSKSITSISNSAPDGDSPNPIVGNYFVTEKEMLFPATGMTVVDSSPPVRWFDWDFNLVGTTDLTSIYANAHVEGLCVIGKDDADNLVVLAQIADNHTSNMTKTSTRILKIAPDFTIAEDILLKEFTDLDNAIWWLPRIHGSCRYVLPIIDKDKKKIYVHGAGKDGGLYSSYWITVDISDITIKEWNIYNYYLQAIKKPTQLTLEVIPL